MRPRLPVLRGGRRAWQGTVHQGSVSGEQHSVAEPAIKQFTGKRAVDVNKSILLQPVRPLAGQWSLWSEPGRLHSHCQSMSQQSVNDSLSVRVDLSIL